MLNPDDDDLKTALAGTQREVYAVVLMDWDRDGTFGHQYSDITELVDGVSVDRSYSSSLPEGVNTVAGFASGRLDVTLGGSESRSGTTALKIFDPYDGTSPLSAYDTIGTPIKVLWRARTPLGDIDTPGFSGNVQSFKVHRVSGTIDLTCVDNYELIGDEVSLPRWAIMSTSPTSDWYENTPFQATPISAQWVLDELMRQCGQGRIREPRSDAISYTSGIGGMLPSIGQVANFYQLGYNVNSTQYLTSGLTTFGVAPALGSVGEQWHEQAPPDPGISQIVYSTLHSSSTIFNAARNGTSDPETNLGCVMNTYIQGGDTTDTDTAVQTRFYLEDSKYGERPFVDPTVYEDGTVYPGRAIVEILYNGQVRLSVSENFNSSYNRRWVWTSVGQLPTYTYPTPNEVWCKLRFLNNKIIPEIRFNGIVQTYTVNQYPGDFGFRYRNISGGDVAGNGSGDATDQAAGRNGGLVRNGRTNLVMTDLDFINDDEWHKTWAIEWFAGGAGVEYIAKPAFPMLTNGEPRFSLWRKTIQPFTPVGSLGLLTALPEVQRANGWETLKAVVAAEQGLLWTDEYGTLNFGDASWGQIPTIPPSVPVTLTVDSFAELDINPTDDNRRNNVILNGQFRGSHLGFVYEQQTGTEKFAPQGTTVTNALLPLKAEASMFNQRMIGVDANPPDSEADVSLLTGRVSAVVSWDPATPAVGWQVSIAPAGSDFRNIFGLWNTTGSGSEDTYIGAYLGANQGNFRVSGRVMTDAAAIQGAARDDDSIALNGVRTLSVDTTEWLQSEQTATLAARELLATLAQPAPQVDDLEIPADPRLQIWDIVKIVSGQAQESGATLYAQITSKTTRWSADEYTDTLKLRVLGNPGSGNWDSAVWDTSTWTE